MTYANESASTRTAGAAAGGGVSQATGRAAPGDTFDIPTTNAAPLSATIRLRRRAGYAGSNGTNAAPAFHTPSIATPMSTPRGNSNATRVSGPAPNEARCAAQASDRASNSA